MWAKLAFRFFDVNNIPAPLHFGGDISMNKLQGRADGGHRIEVLISLVQLSEPAV
jgi:hypothetical protein